MSDLGPQEKVSKLDAARRQLHTAIHLFFAEKDLISVHTLTRASHDIISTLLSTKISGGSFLKDRFLNNVKPEHRAQLRTYLNEPSNFFKHADRDPDDVLKFHHMLCTIWLIDCCTMYKALTGKYSREGAYFAIWFSLEFPEFLGTEFKQFVETMSHQVEIPRPITKDVFLSLIMNPSDFPLAGIESGQ